MLKSLKNINISTLIIHVIITLAYPVIKVSISSANKLLIFTDTLTIISLVLIIIGVFYRLVLKGDFDITRFVFDRSFNKNKKKEDAYFADEKQKRENSFNYPLFLGIIYLVIAIIITWTKF